MNTVIGAEDVEEILSDLGISGSDDAEAVGEVIGAVARRLARKGGGRAGSGLLNLRSALPTRTVVPNSSSGRPRGFPFLMSRLDGVADAATGTMTGTADRRAMLRFLIIEANSAAGARLLGVTVTAITVNGRNAVVGSGHCPAFSAFGEFTPPTEWDFGVVDQGGTATVGVTNNAGAAVDVSCVFTGETTD